MNLHLQLGVFFIFITNKVCIACSRTSYKIVPLTNLDEYLHYDTSEPGLNIYIYIYIYIYKRVNNGSGTFLKKGDFQ
jgi:hypothetical protein